jgi:hypothetical protein
MAVEGGIRFLPFDSKSVPDGRNEFGVAEGVVEMTVSGSPVSEIGQDASGPLDTHANLEKDETLRSCFSNIQNIPVSVGVSPPKE